MKNESMKREIFLITVGTILGALASFSLVHLTSEKSSLSVTGVTEGDYSSSTLHYCLVENNGNVTETNIRVWVAIRSFDKQSAITVAYLYSNTSPRLFGPSITQGDGDSDSDETWTWTTVNIPRLTPSDEAEVKFRTSLPISGLICSVQSDRDSDEHQPPTPWASIDPLGETP